MSIPTEFDDDDGQDVYDGPPVIEPAAEYGYTEPPTDVPPPTDDDQGQNPDHTAGGAA